MITVHICRGCGRTINTEYLYCPWCGYSRIEESANDSLDVVFKRLETMQSEHRENKIEELHTQLEELEKELDTIVLSTEMHK